MRSSKRARQRFQFGGTSAMSVVPGDLRVDRQNSVIYGVCAMAVCEALGHGSEADMITLEKTMALGNSTRLEGIKGRFGHPAMSENSTGRQVQLARNFRISGNKLLHDSYLLSASTKSPVFTQDVVDYMMTIAETNPSEFAESVVISCYLAWRLNDGREFETYWDDWEQRYQNTDLPDDVAVNAKGRPIAATTTLPVIRPLRLHYVDVVNEGALTHEGLFSSEVENGIQSLFEGHSSEYAHDLFLWIDEFATRFKVPPQELHAKARKALDVYLLSRKDFQMDTDNVALGESPPVEDAPAPNSVDALLETATQSMSQIVVPAVETQPVETSESLAPVVDDLRIESLEATVQTLSAQIQLVLEWKEDADQVLGRLTDQMERMGALLNQNLAATKQLSDATVNSVAQNTEVSAHIREIKQNLQIAQRNISRLSGEKVVTIPVASLPASSFEPHVRYVHPTPPSSFAAGTRGEDLPNTVPLANPPGESQQSRILARRRAAQGKG